MEVVLFCILEIIVIVCRVRSGIQHVLNDFDDGGPYSSITACRAVAGR